MKKNTYPKCEEVTANYSCGNAIKTRSTVGYDLSLGACNKCHPFYTGKQRDAATGGHADHFDKRFGIPGSK